MSLISTWFENDLPRQVLSKMFAYISSTPLLINRYLKIIRENGDMFGSFVWELYFVNSLIIVLTTVIPLIFWNMWILHLFSKAKTRILKEATNKSLHAIPKIFERMEQLYLWISFCQSTNMILERNAVPKTAFWRF